MKSISAQELAARGGADLSHREDRRSIPAWLQLIWDAVDAVDYGTIQVKVHANEVVQIETTRKIRVPSKGASSASPEEFSN